MTSFVKYSIIVIKKEELIMKKVNYLKIVALILLIIEIMIVIFIDKDLVKNNLETWRLYVMCIWFIPINIIFIAIKQTRKIKRRKEPK